MPLSLSIPSVDRWRGVFLRYPSPIPKDAIAAALGHGGNTVTDIYIDYDMKKVHNANRKLLRYIFGEKSDSDNYFISLGTAYNHGNYDVFT